MADKNQIAQALKNELAALYGGRLAKLILYGSYARGDYNEDSDIDFLVVLRDDDIQIGAEIRSMRKLASKLDSNFGIYISTHPTTLRKLEESDYIFYKNIRKEGIEV